MAPRRNGLRAFPRQKSLKYSATGGETGLQITLTALEDVFFRSAAGGESRGARALGASLTAIAVANPTQFARLVKALLVVELREEWRASGRPIPAGIRRR
jgi:hypothetical protein